MNIASELTDLINNLGVKDAAQRFGRSPATVKTWLKTGNFPTDVVQKYLDEFMGEMVTAPPMDEEIIGPTLEERVATIENYLMQLNASQPAPTQSPMNAPRVAWAPPGPNDGNFKSFIRPGNGVPGTTLSTPARDAAPAQPVQQPGVRPGLKPADTWLTPIPRK